MIHVTITLNKNTTSRLIVTENRLHQRRRPVAIDSLRKSNCLAAQTTRTFGLFQLPSKRSHKTYLARKLRTKGNTLMAPTYVRFYHFLCAFIGAGN